MPKPRLGRKRLFLLCAALALVLVAVDVHHALRSAVQVQGRYAPETSFDGITAATEARVSIARSDDPALPEPASLDSELSYAQVEAMVRRAVDLIGGFEWLVRPGDRVLIKPNIVDPEPPGTGETTDTRVVKALALLVHEVAGGNAEIIIGEGSPRPMDYELEYADNWKAPAWEKLWDKAGYQDLLADPDLSGLNLRLSNLNGPWEDLVLVDIPHGGYFEPSQGQLWIHKDVLNADVVINVPVMKIHNPGITVALKNNIGLYPATKYGFSRSRGVPQDEYKTRLLHYDDAPRDWVEEQIVDINLVADVDFTVVDAIMCLESNKSALRDGDFITNQVRRNMILASADQVATDHVAARLMGLNPDDVAHITLAAKAGLGNNNAGQIEISGSTVEASWHPFKKDPLYTSDFGQGNRTWLLRGPFPATDRDSFLAESFLPGEAQLRPTAGAEGWSEATYFFDDRIDLGSFFQVDVGAPTAAYAFAFFDAPLDQQAELWVGSDEALRVFINGEIAYEYPRRRTYRNDRIVTDKVPVTIRKGENTLLVKAYQEFSDFHFALNICQPEGDPDLDGNRVQGLKFRTAPAGPTAVEQTTEGLPESFSLEANFPNPFNASTTIPYTVPAGADPEVRLDIFDVRGASLRTLVERREAPGRYLKVWDGRDREGRPMASGAYFYRLQIGAETQTRKMLLLR